MNLEGSLFSSYSTSIFRIKDFLRKVLKPHWFWENNTGWFTLTVVMHWICGQYSIFVINGYRDLVGGLTAKDK